MKKRPKLAPKTTNNQGTNWTQLWWLIRSGLTKAIYIGSTLALTLTWAVKYITFTAAFRGMKQSKRSKKRRPKIGLDKKLQGQDVSSLLGRFLPRYSLKQISRKF